MALYQLYKLDDPTDQNSDGIFAGMVVVDNDVSIITSDSDDYNWRPAEGYIAILHPSGTNQPESGARRFGAE